MKGFVFFSLMIMLLAFPSHFSQAASESIRTWGLEIVPSLFPYMVFCQCLLSQIGRFPRLSLFAIPVLGLLGGSPSGSAALSAGIRFTPLSFAQTLCLCALTGTISPMFFLGPVALWLGSANAARQLLIAHIAGALLASLIVYLFAFRSNCSRGVVSHSANEDNGSPMQRSINAVMNVGGCIVLYSTAASGIERFLPFIDENLRAFLHAILEISGGLKALSQCFMCVKSRMILSAFVSGFGGCSILSQNLLFLRPLGIRASHLLMIGMLRAIASAMIMFILMR